MSRRDRVKADCVKGKGEKHRARCIGMSILRIRREEDSALLEPWIHCQVRGLKWVPRSK